MKKHWFTSNLPRRLMDDAKGYVATSEKLCHQRDLRWSANTAWVGYDDRYHEVQRRFAEACTRLVAGQYVRCGPMRRVQFIWRKTVVITLNLRMAIMAEQAAARSAQS